jgi:tRNA(Ile)-lysidine synthase
MRGARPQAGIEQAIRRDGVIRRGERVLVACSGGPESVALVAALGAVAKPMELALCVAHVNHGTRASAWQDECVAVQVAGACELPVDVLALPGEPGHEAALRAARYAALLECARSRGASVVATAHHAEDQSETVLLALFRGAGPQGLRGMRARRPLGGGVDLARPLLQIPSEALARYCHLHGLPYAIDPTNADPWLRRNAVRAALQALRPLWPGLDRAIARAAALLGDELGADARGPVRRRVRAELERANELDDVDFAHVEAAVRAIVRGSSGRFHMKPGLSLTIERGTLRGTSQT